MVLASASTFGREMVLGEKDGGLFRTTPTERTTSENSCSLYTPASAARIAIFYKHRQQKLKTDANGCFRFKLYKLNNNSNIASLQVQMNFKPTTTAKKKILRQKKKYSTSHQHVTTCIVNGTNVFKICHYPQ